MKVQSKLIKAFGVLAVFASLLMFIPAIEVEAQTTPAFYSGTFGGAPYALEDAAAVTDFKDESLVIEAGSYTSTTEYHTMEAMLISYDGHSTYVTDRGGCIYIQTVVTGLEAGDIVEVDYDMLYDEGSGFYSFYDADPYWIEIGDYTHAVGDTIRNWLIYSEKVSDTEYRLVIGAGEYNLAENTDDLTEIIGHSFKLLRDVSVYRGETLTNPAISSRGYTYSSSEDTSSWSSPIASDSLDTGAMTYIGVQDSYVDDDWAGSSNGDVVGGHVFGQDAFATIQQGIDGTVAGGTVHVAAGTYDENLTVDKPMSLIGAGPADTLLTAPAAPVVLVTANDVIIQNLGITDATQVPEAIRVDGATSNLTVDNVEITKLGAGVGANAYGINFLNPFTGLTVTNSEFIAVDPGDYTRVIGIFAPNDADIADFDISGSLFKYIFVGIYFRGEVDGLDITGNTFGPMEINDCKAAASGIYIGDDPTNSFIDNVNVSSNTFTDYCRGFYMLEYGDDGGSINQMTIANNTFADSIYSSGVRIIADWYYDVSEAVTLTGPVDISGNTFTQNEPIVGGAGVAMIDVRLTAPDATNPLSITGNDITFSGAFTESTWGILVRGPITELDISGNDLQGGDVGGASASMPPTSGIVIVSDHSYFGPISSSAVIDVHDNTISGFENGLSIFDLNTGVYGNLPIGVDLNVNENAITDNTVGVYSGSGETTDATLNYWGSACGPASSDVVGEVTASPWHADAAMMVEVSSDGGGYVFPEGTPVDIINSVIACASPSSTLSFDPGSYPGGLVVDRDDLIIELKGATIGAGSPAFTISGDGITINGPGVLDGDGTDDAVLVEDGVFDFTINQVEITDWTNGVHFDGTVTNTLIVDNYIHDLAGDGVLFDEQPILQTPVSFYIQGNLFMDNGGVGVNNAGTTEINAEYNSWGEFDGPSGLEWDGSTNADTDPFTHVDLYLVSTNPDVDNWANQVFVDDSDPYTPYDTITYQVKAHLVNVTGASFEFSYPTDLLGNPVITNINTGFFPIPTASEIVAVDETGGVISFDGQTGETLLTPLSGDVVLFEVTFTGLLPGVADLDFNEDAAEFSMSPSYGPSNNIYAAEMMDGTVDVITRPAFDAEGIQGPYIAGISQVIVSETCNADTGGDWQESVAAPIEPDTIGWIRISDITIAEIASLEFLYDGDWYDFSVQDSYGGTAVQEVGDDVIARFGNYNFGMEIPIDWCDYDAFRVTFVEPGSHDITVELYDMMDSSQDYIGGDDILLTYLGPIAIEVLGDFDVTGTIAMQGRTVRTGVPLTLTDVNGDPVYGPYTDTSTSELAYNVQFEGVNGSIYEISTLQPRYLNVTSDLDKQFLVNDAYTIDALELKGGNAIWTDNVINIDDASEVGTHYGEMVDQNADVNFDGKVNIQDLALVGGNYDLTSADAYAEWLLPEYNGNVEGIFQDDGLNVWGSVSGDYNLEITGQFTGISGNLATFEGTVSGDFSGTVEGSLLAQGIDPLYAVITVPGLTDPVRLVGNFVRSGIDGHFVGELITGPELAPVTSVTIDGPDNVAVGDTIDLDVITAPAGRDVVWSVYVNHRDFAEIDSETGVLTGLQTGSATVIVVVMDDSNMSFATKTITITAP